MIKECKSKTFNRDDTFYVSYLQELGKILENKQELLNDISSEVESHVCTQPINCLSLAKKQGIDLKNQYHEYFSKNHMKCFEKYYYNFFRLDPAEISQLM